MKYLLIFSILFCMVAGADDVYSIKSKKRNTIFNCKLEMISADTLHVLYYKKPLLIPIDDIEILKLQSGILFSGKGFITGFYIGGILGLVISHILISNEIDDASGLEQFSLRLSAGKVLVIGTVSAAFWGGILGGIIKADRYQKIHDLKYLSLEQKVVLLNGLIPEKSP